MYFKASHCSTYFVDESGIQVRSWISCCLDKDKTVQVGSLALKRVLYLKSSGPFLQSMQADRTKLLLLLVCQSDIKYKI